MHSGKMNKRQGRKKKEKPIPNRIIKEEDDVTTDQKEAMLNELWQYKEMYVPQNPLRFDETGKLLIY